MPAKSWYWLPDESDHKLDTYNPKEYTKNSTQGKYGEYFASIIYRFGLRNVYVTNMLKCGVSRGGKAILKSNQCKSIRDNCISQYLYQEIKSFQPEAMFAFGHNTYNEVRKKFTDYSPSKKLFYLPHPACRTNKKDYQRTSHKHLLFGLKETGIISDPEEKYLSTDFSNIMAENNLQ